MEGEEKLATSKLSGTKNINIFTFHSDQICN